MVGIDTHSHKKNNIRDVDQFDLPGIPPSLPRLSFRELKRHANLVVGFPHTERHGSDERNAGMQRFSLLDATGVLNFLRQDAVHAKQQLSEDRIVKYFYADTAGHESGWNPFGHENNKTPIQVIQILPLIDQRLFQPIPGSRQYQTITARTSAAAAPAAAAPKRKHAGGETNNASSKRHAAKEMGSRDSRLYSHAFTNSDKKAGLNTKPKAAARPSTTGLSRSQPSGATNKHNKRKRDNMSQEPEHVEATDVEVELDENGRCWSFS